MSYKIWIAAHRNITPKHGGKLETTKDLALKTNITEKQFDAMIYSMDDCTIENIKKILPANELKRLNNFMDMYPNEKGWTIYVSGRE